MRSTYAEQWREGHQSSAEPSGSISAVSRRLQDRNNVPSVGWLLGLLTAHDEIEERAFGKANHQREREGSPILERKIFLDQPNDGELRSLPRGRSRACFPPFRSGGRSMLLIRR